MMVESFTQQVNCFTDSRKECQAVQALATPTPFESELGKVRISRSFLPKLTR